jgi:hypothetical protein
LDLFSWIIKSLRVSVIIKPQRKQFIEPVGTFEIFASKLNYLVELYWQNNEVESFLEGAF